MGAPWGPVAPELAAVGMTAVNLKKVKYLQPRPQDPHIPPNCTIYVSNINDRIKLKGASLRERPKKPSRALGGSGKARDFLCASSKRRSYGAGFFCRAQREPQVDVQAVWGNSANRGDEFVLEEVRRETPWHLIKRRRRALCRPRLKLEARCCLQRTGLDRLQGGVGCDGGD